MKMRHAVDTDLPFILKMHNASYPFDQWDMGRLSDMMSNNVPIVVLTKQEEVVGALIYIECLDEIRIINLLVHPNYRRKGYGTKILNTLFLKMQEHNYRYVLLDVRCGNQKAIKLYEQLGFTILCKRKDFYNTNQYLEDGYLLQLEVEHKVLADGDVFPIEL